MENLGIGIASSIIGSFIFIYLLLISIRPKIRISDKICYSQQENKVGEMKLYYIFKIVNNSRWHSIYDLKFTLKSRIPYQVNDGDKTSYRFKDIKITKNNLEHLAKRKKEINYADNAYLLGTELNIKDIISEKFCSVELCVSSKHGLSNINRTIKERFKNKNDIKDNHEFIFGTNTGTRAI
jgi:hypothetical protein